MYSTNFKILRYKGYESKHWVEGQADVTKGLTNLLFYIDMWCSHFAFGCFAAFTICLKRCCQ